MVVEKKRMLTVVEIGVVKIRSSIDTEGRKEGVDRVEGIKDGIA